MHDQFQARVSELLGAFLAGKGFVQEEILRRDRASRIVIVYRSPECKVAFFWSMRDGEVNCLFGPVSAQNADLDGDGWKSVGQLKYLGREPSVEELLAAVPTTPQGNEDELKDIASLLQEKFDEFVSAVRPK